MTREPSGGSGHAFKLAPLLGPLVADVVDSNPPPRAQRFAWRQPDAQRYEQARFTGGYGDAGG